MKKYSQFLKELPSKSVVFAFGRFNPPTIGHELLVKAVKKLATANHADHAIYASKSQDAKKNPLSVDKKVHYLNLMFPGTHFVAANEQERTFIEAVKNLNKKYKNIIMVAGSDRVPEYEKILNKYNGKDFHYDTIQVISAGERDPDADDASGMSASKMRSLASKGDYNGFKKGLPSSMREIDGRRLMNDVRQGMGLDMVKEQINLVKDELREQYFRGEIFNIGDIVESAGVTYEIVKRGSNHLLLKEEDGKLVSKWIQDVTPAEELKLEEDMISEDLTDKTLKSQDKIKVARIIATMLGIDNAETSANPDALVNSALRKVRSKSLNPEALNILNKMLHLATEVGIKYDVSLVPTKLKEAKGTPNDDSVVIDKSTDYNGAKDKLRFSDYKKLKAMNSGHTVSEPGSSLENKGDDDLRRMKVREEKQIEVTMKSGHKFTAPIKVTHKDWHIVKHPTSGKQYRVDHKGNTLSEEEITEERLDEISKELAGNYYGKVVQQHIKKVGVRPNMYDRVSKDLGKKRKEGMDRALDRVTGARKTNEEVELDEATDMATLRQKLNKHTEAAVAANRAGDDEKVKHHQNQVNKIKDRMAKLVRSEEVNKDICPDCKQDPCVCAPKEDEASLGANNAKGFDPFFKEEVEADVTPQNPTVDLGKYETDYDHNLSSDELTDEEIDQMVDEVDDIDDVIDVYDDSELAIVDDETGEEIPASDEEQVNEEVLMEVLSRMERMKAKMRLRRSKAVRERKMKIALKTYSSNTKINERARRLAIKLMKKRMLRGRDASKISVGEKERIERVIEKRKAAINRIAMKLTSRVRKIEKARLSHSKYTKSAPSIAM